MSKRKDTDKTPPATTEISAAAPAEAGTPVASVSEAPKPADVPKPIEAVLQAAEALKPVEAVKPAPVPESPIEAAVASVVPVAAATPSQSRSHRFALLAASVAFAGCVGAMAGALAAAVISQPGPAQSPLAALDLTSVQDSIATLRTELASIKTGVDSNNRNSNAQFAKFSERLERIDRAQAAPAAQLKQAMEAIERLERRVQTSGQSTETTASVRPQQAAVTPPPEPPRQNVLDGWVVRHVNRGVAVIQSRRMGYIEVETGDVVPGVGRIESIRRQDGRWVVVTSKGLITSPTAR